jgi:DNA helicase-4
LIEPIYRAYSKYLEDNDEIDFNDMINKAARYVNQGKYISPYKYVIVDEYQDISKARFMLLSSLRKSNDFDLFCVGDDWQSIYRFAGSDIGFILNFKRYWGCTEESRIETTYRFTKQLIEISGNFVMQNPLQRRKSVKGMGESVGFALGEVNAYNEKYAVKFMLRRLDDLPKGSSVFFIGRYSFDVQMLNNSEALEYRYNNVSGLVEVKYSGREDLRIAFVTAHKAKGLQADYVFIINNKNGRLGFPSKIQDAAVLSLLLEDCDSYPYAEERRLFYVALTRAKKKVILVTVKNQESEFVEELKSVYGNEMKREAFECPICGGRLVKREGRYGEFWGCSNYSRSGCSYKRKIY